MTTEFTPYFMQIFPLPILQERSQIVLSLARYATSSWRDIYSGNMDPRASQYVQSIEAAISHHFFSYYELPKAVRPKMRQPGDSIELVIKAFENAIRYNGIEQGEFGTPHVNNDRLAEVFSKHFDTKAISLGSDAKPSVQGAFQQACDNYRQMQTRMLTYVAIHDLVRESEWNDGVVNRVSCPALRDHLYERSGHFLRDMLVFSGLLGGEVHTNTLKLAARQMCHKEDGDGIQYSIMQFLTADGRHPGSYLGATSDKFAKDIKEKYDAL